MKDILLILSIVFMVYGVSQIAKAFITLRPRGQDDTLYHLLTEEDA